MSDDIGHGMREMHATLDPERSDVGYWHRFYRWVLNAAAPELARPRGRLARGDQATHDPRAG